MQAMGSSVPVLMYHHISPSGGPYCVHPERFRQQLAFLRDAGITPLTGPQFVAFARGEYQPDGRAVLLTFDDGWLDNWVHALPILEEYEIPCVLFVISSWPGAGQPRERSSLSHWSSPSHEQAMACAGDQEKRDEVIMRWSELIAAQDTGLVDLQCHSHSHGQWWNNSGDPAEEFAMDLERSVEELASRTGQAPVQYCWPRGKFTARMSNIVQDAGFLVQHSTLRGANEFGRGRDHVVRRLNIENQPTEWFRRRISLYSRRGVARGLGWCHQELQRQRWRRSNGIRWKELGGLGSEPWRLV